MRSIFASIIFTSIIAFLPTTTFAQSQKAFKHELYQRGLTSLRTLKKPDSFQIENAFQSACAVDSASLVEPLIEEFKMRPFEVFRNVVLNAEYFDDLDLAFRNLRHEDLSFDHSRLIGHFADQLGKRDGDIERLLKKLDHFLKHEPSVLEEDSELPREAIFNRRVEELRFRFQHARLKHHEPPKPLVDVLSGFNSPFLSDLLKEEWLKRMGFDNLSVKVAHDVIESFDSTDFGYGVLIDILEKLEDNQLQSKKGNGFVRFLVVEIFKNPNRRSRSLAKSPDCEFGNGWEGPSRMVLNMSYVFNDDKIATLFRRSKLAENDPEFMKTKEARSVESTEPMGDAKDLGLVFGGRMTIDPDEKELGAPIPKTGFQTALEEIPWERRPEWIVDFVLRYGWQHRDVQPDEFPEEAAILKAFDECKGDAPNIADQLARNIDSFTSPTDASKKLMIKMMGMLPENKQVATKHDLKLLIARFQNAKKISTNELVSETQKLLEKPNHWDNDFPSELAFEFAKRGNKEVVNSLLGRIKGAEDKTWHLFQCAIAFPPHRSDEFWYSPRSTGGMF